MARQAEAVAGAEEEKLVQAVRQIQELAVSGPSGAIETWRGVAMVDGDNGTGITVEGP